MYGYGYGRPAYGPAAYGPVGGAGYGVDVNGDGVVDYNVRPGVGVDVDVGREDRGDSLAPYLNSYVDAFAYGENYDLTL